MLPFDTYPEGFSTQAINAFPSFRIALERRIVSKMKSLYSFTTRRFRSEAVRDAHVVAIVTKSGSIILPGKTNWC